MKKKHAVLEKKLFLEKEVLAALNTNDRSKVLGGILPTRQAQCYTRAETCATIPYTQQACKPCA